MSGGRTWLVSSEGQGDTDLEREAQMLSTEYINTIVWHLKENSPEGEIRKRGGSGQTISNVILSL